MGLDRSDVSIINEFIKQLEKFQKKIDDFFASSCLCLWIFRSLIALAVDKMQSIHVII